MFDPEKAYDIKNKTSCCYPQYPETGRGKGTWETKYYIINSTNALSKIFEISAFNFDVLAVPNSHPNQNHAYSLLVTIQSFKTLRFIYLEQ